MKYVFRLRTKLALGLIILAMSGFGAAAFAPGVSAAPLSPTPQSTPVLFAATSCPKLGDLHKPGSDKPSGGLNCFINTYANPFIKFGAAVTAIFVVISVVIGGIQYATSADEASKVTVAKKRIFDAIVALVAFLFLWAFLKWVVPGGVG